MPTSIESLDLPVLDVLDPSYEADPTGALRAARQHPSGMMKTHRGVEMLTYASCAALINDQRFHTVDARHFADKGGPDSLIEFAENGLLLSMTGERHDRIRRVLVKAFALRRVDQHRVLMAEIAAPLIAHLAEQGEGDLVGDFTDEYPMLVLCRLIGVPIDDIERFVAAARDMHLMAEVPMAPGFDRIDQALLTMRDYVLELVERRRSEPADDLISGIVEAQQTEGALTDAEVVGNVVNLLFAGAGTTRFQLASSLALAIEHDLWDHLAEHPDAIPNFIEEAMRFRPVTQFVVRIPDDDVVIDDLLFPARRRVILNLESAARDASAFTEPDTFLLDRPGLTRSRLPFGWGTHFCLGAALSRAAMTVAIESLTVELSDVAVTVPPELSPARGMLRGPESLVVSFRRRHR